MGFTELRSWGEGNYRILGKKKNIVKLTLNYRIKIMGFLCIVIQKVWTQMSEDSMMNIWQCFLTKTVSMIFCVKLFHCDIPPEYQTSTKHLILKLKKS